MPYFLYRLGERDELDLIREIHLLQAFDDYRAARTEARRLRAEQARAGTSYKVIFADSQLEAEERLLEKREKPVLMEHER